MAEWILLTAAMFGGGDDWRTIVPAPTVLGMNCWSDVAVGANWRLRRDPTGGEFRLLDGAGKSLANGTEKECRAELAKRFADGGARPAKGKVVLMLHGIFRTRHSLEYLAKGFREAGYEAIPIDYASCHLPIERHAENLRALVAELKDAEEIAFVCHSMGGLVTRTYLANGPDPRIKRVVMFGPPIYGSEKADFFQDWGLFNYLFGPSGRQLTTSRLPPAPLPARIEIGVIAGGTGKEKGYSMLLPGDNDGTVTVASTRLAGAHDFVVTPSRHTFMIASAKNRELALRFVREGSFQGEENRRPIPASGVPEGRTERGPEPRRDGAAKTTTEG